jgi:hypothetical protein
MDPSEGYYFNSRPRRYEEKRRRVEAAVEGLVRRYGLARDTAQALSQWIYRLYRILVVLKSLDDQDRCYREWKRPRVILRNGPQMHPTPNFQRKSPT